MEARLMFYRSAFEVRPVTEKDKWCRFTEYKIPYSNSKYGYVVKVPVVLRGVVLSLEGYVIRTKLVGKELWLQVTPFPCKWGVKKEYKIVSHEETMYNQEGEPYVVTVTNLADANKQH